MRILTESELFGRFSLLAHTEEYDALPPISRFSIDYVPSALNPERLALAGYLVFGTWVSGALRFSEPICPELASAIERDSAPVRVRPEEIDYRPKRLPVGMYPGQVSFGGKDEDSKITHSVSVLPQGRYTGALRQGNHLRVASNAHILRGCLPNKDEHRPLLAVAVLAAEDLGIDELRISGSIDDVEISRLQALFGGAGLGVVIADR